MIDLAQGTDNIAPRRGFFRRFGGAMALGLAGLASKPLFAQTQAADVDGPNWPGALQGRHRQVVDAYAVNKDLRSASRMRFWPSTNRRQQSSFFVMTPSR